MVIKQVIKIKNRKIFQKKIFWILAQPESEQTQSATAPVLVPRPNEQTTNGVQATSSFHSVSSIDSSAEMSKYFPDAQTPSLSPFRYFSFLYNFEFSY